MGGVVEAVEDQATCTARVRVPAGRLAAREFKPSGALAGKAAEKDGENLPRTPHCRKKVCRIPHPPQMLKTFNETDSPGLNFDRVSNW